ncbi:Rho termination factor N-terminal domain-containing protein [Pseudonocardia nematodicida]|uniref:Rho termination factor N-terminal domain-containing protein n=1 Tax=Pseudonocardia nematodicida TaxID=1206997 RepID=A0ABV1K9R4_9PSEU
MASSIKDEEMYERLREEGNSKEKSARIANAAAAEGRKTVGRRGGESGDYEDMTKDDLYAQAQKVGITGRSDMSKDELIEALRNH